MLAARSRILSCRGRVSGAVIIKEPFMFDLTFPERCRAFTALSDALNLDADGPRAAALSEYFRRMLFAEDPVATGHVLAAASLLEEALYDADLDPRHDAWAVEVRDAKGILQDEGLGGYVSDALDMMGARQCDSDPLVWRTTKSAPVVRLSSA